MKAARRRLSFTSLDDVMPEVDRLLRGHVTVGNWSLGQICSHLAQAFRFTIDGFPPETRLPWIVRATIGRFLLWRILRTGRFTEGMPMPTKYKPAPGTDAQTEAESLRAALKRFAAHAGPLADLPFRGPVSRDIWDRFHCIHCAHHLGFAVPVVESRGDTSGRQV
jgi:hypothetical protein